MGKIFAPSRPKLLLLPNSAGLTSDGCGEKTPQKSWTNRLCLVTLLRTEESPDEYAYSRTRSTWSIKRRASAQWYHLTKMYDILLKGEGTKGQSCPAPRTGLYRICLCTVLFVRFTS